MIDTVADLDGSILQTLKLLFTRPGSLTNEFLGGRSVSYIAPFKLFLIVSALYFIFGWRAGLELENFDHQIATVIKTYLTHYPQLQSDPAFRTAVEERYVDYFGFSRFVNVFVIAAWASVVFRSSKKMYGEHSIFVLHYSTFDYAVNLAVILILTAVHRSYPGTEISKLPQLLLLSTYLYVVFAVKRVYGGSWGSAVVRSALLFFGDMITTQLASAVALVAAIYFSLPAFH